MPALQPGASARQVVAEIAASKLSERSEDLSAALTIISQRIYAEETHFVLELIQNAEDAGASEIAFLVRHDGVIASNDGRPFDAADVRALASVGKSTKSTATDYIGFFGIGFKSVFKVCDAPRIYSGDYRFTFDRQAFTSDPTAPWQIVPLWLDERPAREWPQGTSFALPFAPRMDDAAIARIAEQFDQLDPRLLLFLRRLRRITVSNALTGRQLAVERRDDSQGITRLRHGRKTQRWRVFRRSAPVPAEVRDDLATREFDRQDVATREVVVAFAVDALGSLTPADDDRLFVFLPTEQRTGLRFLVQGDFLLTAQRDRIQAGAAWNRWLASEVVALLVAALATCREHPRWRLQFYDLVPLPGEVHDPFFRAHVERALLAACRGEPLGLSVRGEWLPPPRLVLAEERLRELLAGADWHELVAPGVECATPELGPRGQLWLAAVGARIVATDELVRFVAGGAWLQRKAESGDAAWFARLYAALHFLLFERYEQQGRRYDYLDARAVLSDVPFVYTLGGTLELPDRVFFPLAALEPSLASEVEVLLKMVGGLHFVHPDALATPTPRAAHRLLADCGVHYPHPREVLERWLLPVYEDERWTTLDAAALRAIVRSTCAWWAAGELEVEGRLAERLGALRLQSSAGEWVRADHLYLTSAYTPDIAIDAVLCGVPFVSDVYLEPDARDDAATARWREFLQAIGVAGRPRVRVVTVFVPGPAPDQAPWWDDYLREGLARPGRGRLRTALVDGLTETLATRDEARLTRLARLLAAHWDTDYAPLAEARWLDGDRPAGDAAFVYLLRRQAWLSTTLGLLPPHAAYAPPAAERSALLSDLLPVIAIPEVAHWAASLGLRPSDTARALVAALAFVPGRLAAAQARDRVFDLYRQLVSRSSATADLAVVSERAGASAAHLAHPSEPETRHEISEPPLRLLGEDAHFHAPAALYIRDDERAYERFRDLVTFAATPPGEAPRRYGALLAALGARSAARDWRAEVVTGEAPAWSRDTAEQAERAVTRLRRRLTARRRYLASLAAHAGAAPPDCGALPLLVVPRLAVREHLGTAEVITEPRAFCARVGEPIYVRAEERPAWLNLADALVSHWGWPREHIVTLRLALTEPADEVELLFRLLGIAFLSSPHHPPAPRK